MGGGQRGGDAGEAAPNQQPQRADRCLPSAPARTPPHAPRPQCNGGGGGAPQPRARGRAHGARQPGASGEHPGRGLRREAAPQGVRHGHRAHAAAAGGVGVRRRGEPGGRAGPGPPLGTRVLHPRSARGAAAVHAPAPTPARPPSGPSPLPQLVPSVVKAIQGSPLSLSPATEGSEVLVKLPRMTKDTIEQVGPAGRAHPGPRSAL
jgi:hypothetical protein